MSDVATLLGLLRDNARRPFGEAPNKSATTPFIPAFIPGSGADGQNVVDDRDSLPPQ